MATPPIEFAQGLRFPCPKPFHGNESEFDNFTAKLRSYLSMSHHQFPLLMKDSQERTTPIIYDDLTDEVNLLSSTLQNALMALTEGSAARIVQRDPQSVNGFESWRLLYQRYKPLARAKATSRLQKIPNWKFNLQDFETSFTEFENEIFLYDSEQDSPFPGEIKAGVLLSRLSGPVQDHLMLNPDVTTPYDVIKETLLK
mgnify:FL=1